MPPIGTEQPSTGGLFLTDVPLNTGSLIKSPQVKPQRQSPSLNLMSSPSSRFIQDQSFEYKSTIPFEEQIKL